MAAVQENKDLRLKLVQTSGIVFAARFRKMSCHGGYQQVRDLMHNRPAVMKSTGNVYAPM